MQPIFIIQIAQIFLIIGILVSIFFGVYGYYQFKRSAVLEPHKTDFLQKSKEIQINILKTKRNLNYGIVASILLILLSVLMTLIAKSS